VIERGIFVADAVRMIVQVLQGFSANLGTGQRAWLLLVLDTWHGFVGFRRLQFAVSARLGHACLADPRVTQARIRVEKPLALAPDAVAAGVEITIVRD